MIIRPLIGIALLAVSTGCSAQQASSSTEDTLVIGLSGAPATLNPVFGDIYGTIYGDHWPIFSSILDYDQDLELRPDLAAEMPQFSEDNTQVTVKLRDDVTWHDGEAFTAEDVVFTYNAILDPDVATRTRDLLFDSVESVEAVDDATVQFNLSRRDPAFFDKLTTGIIPEHVLAGEDLNTTAFNLDPVGTGPFVFDELREGERMVLVANDDYYGGDVALSRVVFTFVEDENARVSRLEAGAIDVDAVGLSPRVVERFRDREGFDVVQVPAETLGLMLPTHNPVLRDAETRRAIGMAIDREALVGGLYADLGRVVAGPFPPQHWAHDPQLAATFAPDRAAELLADAGWTPGPDGVLERDGEPFVLEVVYDPATQEAALVIRDSLAAAGISVELAALGHGEQQERIAAGAAALSYGGNSFDPDLDAWHKYHSSGAADDDPGSNQAGIADEAVDAALEASRAAPDRAARRNAYVDLQTALAAQGSWQFLVQYDHAMVASDHVQGVAPASLDGHVHGFSRGLLWNLHEWSLGE